MMWELCNMAGSFILKMMIDAHTHTHTLIAKKMHSSQTKLSLFLKVFFEWASFACRSKNAKKQ